MNVLGTGSVIGFAQVTADSSDVWEGWGSVVLVVVVITLVCSIIALVVWQGMKLSQTRITTRASIAQDEAYRSLAAAATAAQQKIAEEQAKIARELSALHSRTAELERILKQVE